MGKISKILLNSLFVSSATAENIQVTGCNDETLDNRPPALSFKIAQEYFDNNLSDQSDSFVLDSDGAFYERTIGADELTLTFDTEADDILLSYTLAITNSGFELDDSTSIKLAEDAIQLQCRYARSVSANSDVTVGPAPTGPTIGSGDLTYNMNVVAGTLGGTTQVTISPTFTVEGISPSLTSCKVTSGEHEIYAVHSFQDNVCFDNTRLNVQQTTFGSSIGFSMRTFRFMAGDSATDEQEQTISCDLHLGPSDAIVEEQAADCTCHTEAQCDAATGCGSLFPFGQDSDAQSIIQHLHHIHGYRTRITDAGVAIYKIYNPAPFESARQLCTQESTDASDHLGDTAVQGFLHLPMPKNDAENELYSGLPYDSSHTGTWADITRVGNTNAWEYPDGTTPTFFDWHLPSEPNNSGGDENNVEMKNNPLRWNDLPGRYDRTVVCTYFLPAGAEETCPWLKDMTEFS